MADRRHTYVDFLKAKPTALFAKTTNAIATAADNQEDYMWVDGEHYFEHIQTGANAVIQYLPSATLGWIIPLDAADADGVEITQGILSTSPMKFVTGTDAFYMKVAVQHAVLADADVFAVGFRNLTAYVDITTPGTLASVYNNKVSIGVDDASGRVRSNISVADSDTATTATNTPLIAATTTTWEIYVSAARVCTFKVNGVADTLLNAGAANTLTTGITMVPFIAVVSTGAASASPCSIVSFECGLQ